LGVQVDLYENGTIAIVEAVSPELGNRVQRVRVQLPGTSSGECTAGVVCWVLLVPSQQLYQRQASTAQQLSGRAHWTQVAATSAPEL
jgi:hypothetical protein